MFVGEDLFVACAEIAHALSMDTLDVAVQIWPAQAGKVARAIRAVVSKKENCITDNVFVCVLDTNVAVGCRGVFVGVFLEALVGIVCEDDVRSGSLALVSNCFPIPKITSGLLGNAHSPLSYRALAFEDRKCGT